MSSYLLYVMFASREYLSLGCKWIPNLPSICVYCMMLQENKYKEDYDKICNGLFSPICQILFGEEEPTFSLKGYEIVYKYDDWYINYVEVYIKMTGISKASHWIPHLVPEKKCFFRKQDIKLIFMVLLLHCIRKKMVFGIIFLYPWEFAKLKILRRIRKKSTFYPPSSLKR